MRIRKLAPHIIKTTTLPSWQAINANTIQLQFGKSILRLNTDGTIEIIGKQILQHAEDNIILQSNKNIHLNTI